MDIRVYLFGDDGSIIEKNAVFDTGAQITLIPRDVPIYFEQTGETELIAFDMSPQYTAPAGYTYASLDGVTWEKIRCARGGQTMILSPEGFREFYFVIIDGTVSAYRKQ